MDRFLLQSKEITAISEEINRRHTRGLRSSIVPHFYIVGGQPGCGKTELINTANEREVGDLLICNADDLRNYHPDVKEIRRCCEDEYPTITWPYASQWNNALKEYGIRNRLNVLVETTLHNKVQVLEQFSYMKEQAYRTCLFLLAVPARLSWIGTCLRFETMKVNKGFGRRVSTADHDIRFERLVANLPSIMSCPDIDQIEVFGRKNKASKKSDRGVVLLTNERKEALNCFINEIDRKPDYSDWEVFYQQVTRVAELMKDRKANAEELKEFDERVALYKTI